MSEPVGWRTRLSALPRLARFVAITGLTSIVGLIAVPVIIAGAGGFQWAVQAALQSTATLFGVVVGFGWGTTGAAEVAAMPAAERPRFYAGSLVSRLYLFVLAYPAMVIVMAVLNPTLFPLVAVGSAAYLVPFLGASWYFVGEANPSRLFRLDALPQVLGLALGVVVMLVTRSLVATVATQLVCNLAGVVAAGWVILHDGARPARLEWSLGAATRRLAGQRHSVTTAATTSLYVATPLLVLNAVNPAVMPAYAMGDKLFRFALTAFAPVLQFVQGWIPEGGRANMTHRLRQAARFAPIVSVAGAACILLLGPIAARLLSATRIDFGYVLATPFAIIFLAVSVTEVLGLACLVQLGRGRDLAVSTVLGAVAGVPLIVAGAWFAGALGVAWAVAISELVVLAYQARIVWRELRVPSGPPASEPTS